MTVVTMSASYGAGGSRVAPEVARRLGARFYDRAIPREVAARLAVPLEQALARDESSAPAVERVLESFARLGTWYGSPVDAPPVGAGDFQRETERLIYEAAESGAAVILGRGAAIVLGSRPGVLHVRLDGPRDARATQAAQLEGIELDVARRNLRDADRARHAYVRHFYGVDPADPRLYHLVVDSTALDLGTCAQLVADAARARAASPVSLPPSGR